MSRHRVGHTIRASTPEEMLTPYRALALRVISVAMRDLITPGQSASDRDTARAFLSGSRMLTHWCTLADIDPEAVRKQMRGVIDGQRRAKVVRSRTHVPAMRTLEPAIDS